MLLLFIRQTLVYHGELISPSISKDGSDDKDLHQVGLLFRDRYGNIIYPIPRRILCHYWIILHLAAVHGNDWRMFTSWKADGKHVFRAFQLQWVSPIRVFRKFLLRCP